MQYTDAMGKISTLALQTTLVGYLSLNGQVLLQHLDSLILVSIPLLLGFVIVAGHNLLMTRLLILQYREAITTVLIGSSRHFEIAIATTVSLDGVGSQAASVPPWDCFGKFPSFWDGLPWENTWTVKAFGLNPLKLKWKKFEKFPLEYK